MAGASDSCAVERRDSVVCEFHFRLDSSVPDTSYLGNMQALARFRDALDSIGTERIKEIRIVSQSSPEGPLAHNMSLSRERANAVHNLMSTLGGATS